MSAASRVESAVGRHGALLLALAVLMASAAAGYGIYAGQRKILVVLAAFTATFLFRRNTFTDFYLVTIGFALLANTRGAFSEDADRYKWESLFVMGLVSLVVIAASVRDIPKLAPEHLFMVTFTLLAVWSVSWSLLPTYSFQKVGAFSVVLLVAFGGCWFWARDLPRVQALVNVHLDWVWFVFPPALADIVLRPGSAWIGGRLSGPFENPNNLGFWASTTVPLLFAASLTHAIRWRRYAAGFLAVTGIMAAALAASRGGLLGAFIGIGTYCLLRFTKRTLAVLALLAVFVGFWRAYDLGLGALRGGTERVLRPETLDDFADRTIMWELCLVIAKERPWMGHGFGQGELLLPLYGFEQVPGHFGVTVHNTYMEVWLNDGLIGLALFLLVAGGAGLRGLLTWHRDRHGPQGLLALGLACTLLAGSAHAFVETVFTNPGSPWTLPFWTTIALLIRLHVMKPVAEPLASSAAVPGATLPGLPSLPSTT